MDGHAGWWLDCFKKASYALRTGGVISEKQADLEGDGETCKDFGEYFFDGGRGRFKFLYVQMEEWAIPAIISLFCKETKTTIRVRKVRIKNLLADIPRGLSVHLKATRS